MRKKTGRAMPRKYDFETPVKPMLLEEDEHVLAKLVDKYGADTVIAAVPNAKRRPRGRPSKGQLPNFEKMSDADWIDARAEEYRAHKHPTPIRQARIDYFHFKHGHELNPPSSSELATVQKLHLAGKKLRASRARVEK